MKKIAFLLSSLLLLATSALADVKTYREDLDSYGEKELIVFKEHLEEFASEEDSQPYTIAIGGTITISKSDGGEMGSFEIYGEHLEKIEFVSLNKNETKQIVVSTHSGNARMDLCIYMHKDGVYKCLFHSYDGYVELSDKDGQPIIKRAWPTGDFPQSSRYENCYWAVYVWNGEKFIYSPELSDIPKTMEEKEHQWYLAMSRSLGQG